MRNSTSFKNRRKDSDNDSGFPVNGERVITLGNGHNEPRYESDRIQRQAAVTRSPQSSILKSSPRDGMDPDSPTLVDLVLSRPQVSRIPSSGRSTPSKLSDDNPQQKGSFRSSNSSGRGKEAKIENPAKKKAASISPKQSHSGESSDGKKLDDLPETHGARPKTKSPSPLKSSVTTDESSDFDGVYYTEEPLNNRPERSFPNTQLDEDINMKSYKTHEGLK